LQTLDDGHGRVGRAWILEESLRDPFARQYTRDWGPVKKKKKWRSKFSSFPKKKKGGITTTKKNHAPDAFVKSFEFISAPCGRE
jgi:hypothetical protein